jgi:hypothetical protein
MSAACPEAYEFYVNGKYVLCKETIECSPYPLFVSIVACSDIMGRKCICELCTHCLLNYSVTLIQ